MVSVRSESISEAIVVWSMGAAAGVGLVRGVLQAVTDRMRTMLSPDAMTSFFIAATCRRG